MVGAVNDLERTKIMKECAYLTPCRYASRDFVSGFTDWVHSGKWVFQNASERVTIVSDYRGLRGRAFEKVYVDYNFQRFNLMDRDYFRQWANDRRLEWVRLSDPERRERFLRERFNRLAP